MDDPHDPRHVAVLLWGRAAVQLGVAVGALETGLELKAGGLQDDVLVVVKHGLDYLLQCFIKDPTTYADPQGDIYVYQVGNIERESARWFRPEDVKVRPNSIVASLSLPLQNGTSGTALVSVMSSLSLVVGSDGNVG